MDEPKSYIGFKAWGLGIDAHLTMIYTGDLTEDQVSEIRTILLRDVPSTFYSLAKRVEIKLFGPDEDIPVLIVDCLEEVHALRQALLGTHAIQNASEFDWNPHVTLKFTPMQPLVIPSLIKLTHLDVY